MIYGYIRVSSDKQTTENQHFEITNYTNSKELPIDEWIEETISATKKLSDRKLGRLLEKMQKGDILIVTELSRLGRNLMQINFAKIWKNYCYLCEVIKPAKGKVSGRHSGNSRYLLTTVNDKSGAD